MKIVTFDLVRELKKFSLGKKTKVDPFILAALAADHLQDKDVEELEQLFRLKDPRG